MNHEPDGFLLQLLRSTAVCMRGPLLANNTYNSSAVPSTVSLAFDATLHKESAMSNVVNMKDYHKKIARGSSDAIRDGLIPIEFAFGINIRGQCLDKMSACGVGSIYVRTLTIILKRFCI